MTNAQAATADTDRAALIRAGQLVLIKGAVTRVGTKSFSHEMRLYEADSMTHCATQKTVEVCFDTRERKGVALPEEGSMASHSSSPVVLSNARNLHYST